MAEFSCLVGFQRFFVVKVQQQIPSHSGSEKWKNTDKTANINITKFPKRFKNLTSPLT